MAKQPTGRTPGDTPKASALATGRWIDLAEIPSNALQECQPHLTDDERLILWGELTNDYCTDCGRETNGATCHCTNDE